MLTLHNPVGGKDQTSVTYMNSAIRTVVLKRNAAGYPELIQVWINDGSMGEFAAEPPSTNWSNYQAWLEAGE